MAAPRPSALARPSRRARFLPVGGLCPPRPHPGGASAARRSGPPTRPGFSSCGGRSPPRPRWARRTRRGFEGSRAFCPGEAALLALPAGHGAHGADSRAAARSVRGRLRPPRPRRARRTRRGFEGSRTFCPGEAALLALPVGHGARGADSRAAARSVRGRLRPSRSPPVRCPRRGFEGSRAFCPGEAAALTLPAGHGARGADSRAAARSVRGRLRPSRSPPVRCPRRGFKGSRAFCPGEAAALTLPAGHGARGAGSRAAARSVRGRLRPSRSPPVRCPRRGFKGSPAPFLGSGAGNGDGAAATELARRGAGARRADIQASFGSTASSAELRQAGNRRGGLLPRAAPGRLRRRAARSGRSCASARRRRSGAAGRASPAGRRGARASGQASPASARGRRTA